MTDRLFPLGMALASLIVISVILGQVERQHFPDVPAKQTWSNTDNDRTTGYGASNTPGVWGVWGVEVLKRGDRCYAAQQGGGGPGDWGLEVPCPDMEALPFVIQWFDEERVNTASAYGSYYRYPSADIDDDGDVDLADFAMFQLAMGGP